jgi:hypothetical protein
MRHSVAVLFVVVLAVLAAAVSPGRAAVGGAQGTAKTCYLGYVHAAFPWGERCIRAGQYCRKVRNPQYHKYGFQCVNGKLRKQNNPKEKQNPNGKPNPKGKP